ncbi:PRK06851 family protein [Desulforamulus aquiferis]|uniref:PRK06851 family protein n=1 Tax=Desulforamulus aquiferis TaxID=1397668 RepID=A0AAW7Z921_9FIRM|nr:PRK06851 family protein [Desulforamulus aquiferis]MDO7785754.1 PRK06851 family protein [Desulforamulus aquiferis]
MAKGKLKKVFPGGNTSKGFFSYYNHIIEPNSTRIFVIKGGPGVGKSTFMRYIGEQMLELGYDVEYHCCSSDNGSLDGVCIPSIGVALLDGTAPHVVDPKNPGVVDEIIHLGDFWDEEKMRENKEGVLKANARVGRLFKIAYSQLAEAKVIKDELDSYYSEAMNMAGVYGVVHDIAEDILEDVMEDEQLQFEKEPKERHLFATAFTPKGQAHHLETLLDGTKKLYYISGDASAIGSEVVGTLAKAMHMHGLATEVYHCSFEPTAVDLVVIPDIKIAILKQIPGIEFSIQNIPGLKKVKLKDLNKYLDLDVLALYHEEIKGAKERLTSAIGRAMRYISAAKAEHDLMELYYIPAMNFEAINEKRREIFNRILKYAEEQK